MKRPRSRATGLALSSQIEFGALSLADPRSQPGLPLAGDHQQIAGASLDDLRLDRLQPHARGGSVLADAVHQDAAVAGLCGAVAVRRAAPLPLDDQVVIAVHLPRRDAAPLLAGDAQDAVLDREDALRVGVLVVAEEGVPAVEIASVEQRDRLLRRDRLLARTVRVVQQRFGGGEQPLARPPRGTRGHDLVVALVERRIVREVRHRPVRQLRHDGQGKWRGALDAPFRVR